MTGRPPRHRKSGRAPKFAVLFEPIEPLTIAALEAAVYLQNEKRVPDVGPKSRHLSNIASDLELALVLKKPKDVIERLCLEVAALAVRILEQGDGPPADPSA